MQQKNKTSKWIYSLMPPDMKQYQIKKREKETKKKFRLKTNRIKRKKKTVISFKNFNSFLFAHSKVINSFVRFIDKCIRLMLDVCSPRRRENFTSENTESTAFYKTKNFQYFVLRSRQNQSQEWICHFRKGAFHWRMNNILCLLLSFSLHLNNAICRVLHTSTTHFDQLTPKRSRLCLHMCVCARGLCPFSWAHGIVSCPIGEIEIE